MCLCFCLRICLCPFVERRRDGGKQESTKKKSRPSGNRTNATDVLGFFFFVFFIRWRRSEWEELDTAGDTSVAAKRDFTVQTVNRTQCRLVCTQRDLAGWAGPVGWAGLKDHPLLTASRITVAKNRTLIHIML